MTPYDHSKIEKKQQKLWAKNKLFVTKEDSKKEKCYVLDMFPYPSGEGLHVGHPKGYVATDIYSRYKKMRGFNILHPMGWDAFGLPAENYAIKTKTHPQKTVTGNIKYYKEQLSIIGCNYDWNREINTTDPEYYRWTQWIFLQMYKKGLAYESHEPINWCPSCQTGLANEDLEDGKCERCGSEVERRPMRQWVLRITDYAERLLSDLTTLHWPESIKESQRNWIGKSEGAEIEFPISNGKFQIKVFTTRPETIFGATAIVLSPEHEFLMSKSKFQISNEKEVRKYIEESKKKTEIERTDAKKEKTGIKLEGIFAINPATKEKIPVFIADYVLTSYGTGAVMSVPAHDERDFAFAKKYGFEIKQVVAEHLLDKNSPPRKDKKTVPRKVVQGVVKHWSEDKILALNWKEQPWKTFVIGGVEDGETFERAAEREVREETGYKNVKVVRRLGWKMISEFFAAHKDVNRYADMEVFLVQLENGDQVPLTDEENAKHSLEWIDQDKILDLINPCNEKYVVVDYMKGEHAYTGDGKLINSGKFDGVNSNEVKDAIIDFVGGKKITKYKLRDWVFSRQRYWGEPIPLIHCEKCGVVPVPEKDLPVKLPNVKHYEPTGTGESPLAAIEKWVNVKCPQCKSKAKRETNTMPQWAGSCWYYLRFMDPKNKKVLVDPKKEKYWAPIDMYVGGAEHATRHLIYARFWHKFLFDIGVASTSEPFSKLHNVGLILAEDGRKMSKRYGNVVNPDDIIGLYGADTFRVYEMFMGPFSQSSAWNTKSIIGSRRFIERVWRLQEKVSKNVVSSSGREKKETLLHQTIKKVGEDIEKFSFNTAISSLMILVSEFENSESISKKEYEILLQLLSPFAPHVTDELWSNLKNKKSIHLSGWPQYDESKLVQSTFPLVIQVNGKVRKTIEVSSDIDEEDVKQKALADGDIKKWLNKATIKKTVYIPKKLLNIVI